MREILFRGKVVQDCNYKGKFIHGDFGYGNCIRPIENVGDNINKIYRLYDELAFVEVDPETLGQFTGLLDKNGKKIFEGDILSLKDEVGKKGIVTVGFEDGGFIVFKGLAWRYIGAYLNIENELEIVGNIHDNGELYREIKGVRK
jgi:uncharacterized phage protein (TIGR01671 family)